jgi:hypothetical protein
MPRFPAPAVLAAGLLLAAAGAAAEPRLPDALRAIYEADPIASPLTEANLVRDTIDPHAQRAILKLSRDGDHQDRAFALMLGRAAVRGQLGGIYLENTRVPILRAKQAGLPWWEILPKGKHAICWAEPAEEAPVIVFDESIRGDADAVSLALREAFLECGLGYLVVDAVDAQGGYRDGCSAGIAANEALGYQGTGCEDCSEIEPLRPGTYDASVECEGKAGSASSQVKPGEVTITQIDPLGAGAQPATTATAPPKSRIPLAAMKKASKRIAFVKRSAEPGAEAEAADADPAPGKHRPTSNDL